MNCYRDIQYCEINSKKYSISVQPPAPPAVTQVINSEIYSHQYLSPTSCTLIIEEGFEQKTTQRSSCRIGVQNPGCASCFASVFLNQTVESTICFQKDRDKTASAARGKVELNRLFQKDRGKTASAAKILSPNPTQRPLPCLLIKFFFYDPHTAVTHHKQLKIR